MKFEREATIKSIQPATRDCHVWVELTMKNVKDPGIHVAFAKPADEASFSCAVTFGLEWVVDRFSLDANGRGLHVTISSIVADHHFMRPRGLVMVVAMLAAQCVCAAIGADDEASPYLDTEKRCVVFPL